MSDEKMNIENMKIYKDKNVVEASLDRIRRLFDEFPNIVLCHSGGKDSTVTFHLALQVAKERDRLPLKVMFIDQEAEWQGTIDIIREVMHRDDVEPYWYQMPIKLFNATSFKENWLWCWNEEEKENWIHEKDPVSIKENYFDCERFKDLFRVIPAVEWGEQKTALLAGMRTEENPARFLGIINGLTYKDISWGRKHTDKGKDHHYTFYPIYDWSYTDVWKAIHENDWNYNRIYDLQYQHGVGITDMRVSNLHHATSVWSLFYMQKLEPETHNKLTNRLDGVDGATKMGKDNFYVDDLPYMFGSWKEYRDFLLFKLVEPEHQLDILEEFIKQDFELEEEMGERLHKSHVKTIVANNYHGTKLKNLRLRNSNSGTREKRDEKLEELGFSNIDQYVEEVIKNEYKEKIT